MTIFQPEISVYLEKVFRFLPQLVSALLIFVLSLYIAGRVAQLLTKTLNKRNSDPETTALLAQLTRWGLIIAGIISALQQVGFDLTAFMAGLGILGFTIGFAIQDVSKNLVAGILLLLQQPFELEDFIEISGHSGTVKSVDLRATRLLTPDGNDILIPNAEVYTTSITNFSRTPTRRVEIEVGVGYASDLSTVRNTVLQAIQNLPDLLDNPKPRVLFHTFGDSAIEFTLQLWVDIQQIDIYIAKNQAMEAIKEAFEKANIEIPFPVQTVILQK